MRRLFVFRATKNVVNIKLTSEYYNVEYFNTTVAICSMNGVRRSAWTTERSFRVSGRWQGDFFWWTVEKWHQDCVKLCALRFWSSTFPYLKVIQTYFNSHPSYWCENIPECHRTRYGNQASTFPSRILLQQARLWRSVLVVSRSVRESYAVVIHCSKPAQKHRILI
jgi:hypothetical protein